jgi:hypothetical protein
MKLKKACPAPIGSGSFASKFGGLTLSAAKKFKPVHSQNHGTDFYINEN